MREGRTGGSPRGSPKPQPTRTAAARLATAAIPTEAGTPVCADTEPKACGAIAVPVNRPACMMAPARA
ncbi:MAG TPA: hypothetical protein VGF17_03675, partial [Phytomonospora sp.]